MIAGRVLVAGVGNALRGDDAFGVEAARRFSEEAPPERVTVLESGIGGISLVQELMRGYDALIVLDAEPLRDRVGGLRFVQLEVPELDELEPEERAGLLADTHQAEPTRALTLARALGVLPPRVYLLGCQADPERDFGPGLSAAVGDAVEESAGWLRRLLVESMPTEDDHEAGSSG